MLSNSTYEEARKSFYSRGSSKKDRNCGYDLSEGDEGINDDDDADCLCD